MNQKDIMLHIVSEDDCRDLWVWRNHPEVRKNFFNKQFVSWKEHVKWFYSKIRDKNTTIYIARQGNDKVGVIRFEAEGSFVKVHVNLNPDHFGKKLGRIIIKKGTKEFFDETKRKKPIIAEIKEDNIASQKAFTKAGYKFDRAIKGKLIYKKAAAYV